MASDKRATHGDWFVVHDGLSAAARFPALVRTQARISVIEVAILLTCGIGAAVAVGFVKLGLGIPGHAIVLAALPMAFGLAAAPRRLAGTIMGAGACGTALLVTAAGSTTYGSGAIVSLSLLGPLLDVAVRNARHGWLVYAALVAAGVSANLLALASRAATKVLGLDAGSRPFDSWWLQAIGTYTLSGIVAGLLGAMCWFHFRDRRERQA
jgi:hypothetical protein